MLSFLSNIFGGMWAKIAIVAAAAIAVLIVLAGARSAGKDSERVKTARKTLDVIKKQREALARAPGDRDGVVDRMHDGTF